MSGCCARCKVPYPWCGDGACKCHKGARKRSERVDFEDAKAAVDAEIAQFRSRRKARRRYL